jgi:hypothetical protein
MVVATATPVRRGPSRKPAIFEVALAMMAVLASALGKHRFFRVIALAMMAVLASALGKHRFFTSSNFDK